MIHIINAISNTQFAVKVHISFACLKICWFWQRCVTLGIDNFLIKGLVKDLLHQSLVMLNNQFVSHRFLIGCKNNSTFYDFLCFFNEQKIFYQRICKIIEHIALGNCFLKCILFMLFSKASNQNNLYLDFNSILNDI